MIFGPTQILSREVVSRILRSKVLVSRDQDPCHLRSMSPRRGVHSPCIPNLVTVTSTGKGTGPPCKPGTDHPFVTLTLSDHHRDWSLKVTLGRSIYKSPYVFIKVKTILFIGLLFHHLLFFRYHLRRQTLYTCTLFLSYHCLSSVPGHIISSHIFAKCT